MAEPEWLAEAEEVPEGEMPEWASDAEEVAESIPASPEFAAEPPAPGQAPAPAPNVSMSPGWRLPLQGMTLGWGDEAVAAAKSALGERTYEQELARERARLEAERETSPSPALAEFAGGLPLALLPGGASTSLPRMAATGAGLGAVSGAGASDADTVGGRARGALAGGAAGLATGAAGFGLGKGLERAGGALMRRGAEKTAESIGATPPQFRKLQQRHGSMEQLGDKMRAAGLTGSAKRIAQRSEDLVEGSGSRIGEIYDAAEEAVDGAEVVDVGKIRAALQSRLAETADMPEEGARNRVFQKWIKALEGKDTETIKRMHRRLRAIQKQGQVPKRGSPRHAALGEVADAYRSELQEAVSRADPGLLKELAQRNREFSLAKDVAPAAAGEVDRLASHRGISLGGMLMGGVGVGAYGPMGAAAGLAAPLVRRYRKPVSAAALRAAGKAARTGGRAAESGRRLVAPAAAGAGAVAGDERGKLRASVRSTTDTARELVSSPSRDLLALGQDGLSLQRAAAKGDQEFNSEHWRLMMSSPEYRAKMRELEEKRISEDTQ